MSTGTRDMARPKRRQEPEPEPKPPPRPGSLVSVVHLMGTPEYKAYLDDLQKRTHYQKTTIVRLAIAEWAEKHGHLPPPEI